MLRLLSSNPPVLPHLAPRNPSPARCEVTENILLLPLNTSSLPLGPATIAVRVLLRRNKCKFRKMNASSLSLLPFVNTSENTRVSKVQN